MDADSIKESKNERQANDEGVPAVNGRGGKRINAAAKLEQYNKDDAEFRDLLPGELAEIKYKLSGGRELPKDLVDQVSVAFFKRANNPETMWKTLLALHDEGITVARREDLVKTKPGTDLEAEAAAANIFVEALIDAGFPKEAAAKVIKHGIEAGIGFVKR